MESSGSGSYQVCALVRQPIAIISTPLVFAPNHSPGNRWEYVTIDSCVFDIYDRRPWVDINAATNLLPLKIYDFRKQLSRWPAAALV